MVVLSVGLAPNPDIVELSEKLGVGLNAQHFLTIANYAWVLGEAVDLIRAEHHDLLRGKTEKHVFKIIPLAIDNAPHEACLKDTAGHLRQPTVVFAAGKRSRAALCRHHGVEGGLPSVTFTGALVNRFKAFQLVLVAAVAKRLVFRGLATAEKNLVIFGCFKAHGRKPCVLV